MYAASRVSFCVRRPASAAAIRASAISIAQRAGSSGGLCRLVGAAGTAELAVVEMVRVTLTGLAFGVTDGGAKEQELSAGRPEQERETAPPKEPNCGLTVRLYVADWPALTVTLAGEAPTEKSATANVKALEIPPPGKGLNTVT